MKQRHHELLEHHAKAAVSTKTANPELPSYDVNSSQIASDNGQFIYFFLIISALRLLVIQLIISNAQYVFAPLSVFSYHWNTLAYIITIR